MAGVTRLIGYVLGWPGASSTSLAVVVVLLSVLLWRRSVRRGRRFPPGPPAVPVLGSFPFLPDKPIEHVLEENAEKYGNVYSLKLGSIWVVALNSFKTIQAALVGNSIKFAGRTTEVRHLKFNPHSQGIIDSQYSNALKDRRQFVLHVLKNFGYGKRSLGSRIQEEVNHTLATFAAYDKRPFDPKPHFHAGVGNIICSLLFGKRFDHADKQFGLILHSITNLFGTWLKNPAGDFIPVLRLRPEYKKTITDFTRYGEVISDYIKKEIREHQATFDPGNLRDLTDACLYEIHTKNSDAMNAEQILPTLMDFFTAGSDTITVTLQWAVLYLINNPDVQRRAQEEIDSVLRGSGRESACVTLDDRDSLPYTEACVMEVQRMASILPTSVWRATTVQTEFNNFSIPKSTWVVPNLWGVSRDPSLWDAPERFYPERFLAEDGHVSRPESWVPFGMGRRSCPGENLARQELFLYVTGMLQKFTIVAADGASLPETRLQGGIVVSPKSYQVKALPR